MPCRYCTKNKSLNCRIQNAGHLRSSWLNKLTEWPIPLIGQLFYNQLEHSHHTEETGLTRQLGEVESVFPSSWILAPSLIKFQNSLSLIPHLQNGNSNSYFSGLIGGKEAFRLTLPKRIFCYDKNALYLPCPMQ